MPRPPSRKLSPIQRVLEIMATLRAPDGCPWDREQDHRTLRWHAVEEVYELLDAIEAADDHELVEELGDVLLQVVFHSQLARERGVFDFDGVCQQLADKLVRRHPHVFGELSVKDVDQVWANWEKIKHSEKRGTSRERPSSLDGVPRHLPALMRAQKMIKKARKAGLEPTAGSVNRRPTKSRLAAADLARKRIPRSQVAIELFRLAELCQIRGWSAEELLNGELNRRERAWRRRERMLESLKRAS